MKTYTFNKKEQRLLLSPRLYDRPKAVGYKMPAPGHIRTPGDLLWNIQFGNDAVHVAADIGEILRPDGHPYVFRGIGLKIDRDDTGGVGQRIGNTHLTGEILLDRNGPLIDPRHRRSRGEQLRRAETGKRKQ